MSNTGTVLVVGSLNADLTIRTNHFPQPGETVRGTGYTQRPGGKSANQSVASALAGAPTTLIGAVGDDAHGTLLVESVRSHGIDVSGIRRLMEAPTGTAFIIVDSAGENSILVFPGANRLLDPAWVTSAELETTAVVCLALEIDTATVSNLATRASQAGCTVLLNASPTSGLPAALLKSVDILVVNEGELSDLIGSSYLNSASQSPDWSRALGELAGIGVRRAIITRGSAGAAVLDQEGDEPIALVDSPSVEVVDTTGCGDAFMGVVAARLAAGDPLVESARWGCIAGALAATGEGAQRSYRPWDELREFASN